MTVKIKKRNQMNGIISQIKDVLDINTEYTPFLNKYYLELNTEIIHLLNENDDLYNKSILILDEEGTHNDSPYIMEMDKDRIDALTTYYGVYPIHKTNRLAINWIEDYLKNQRYISLLEELISEYIIPEILITFSDTVGKIIRSKFKIELQNRLEATELWSGFVKMGNKYFFIYCLPDIAQTDMHSNEIYNFIMSSRVYEFHTSFHINEILKSENTLVFPENAIENHVVREGIKHLRDLSHITIAGLNNRNGISEMADLIKDYDIYDLLIAQELNQYNSISVTNLTKGDYLQLRKKESSATICRKYFDKRKLKYKYYIVQFALIRFYLYMKHPQKSFDIDWKIQKRKAEDIIDNYNNVANVFDEYQIRYQCNNA